MHALGEIQRTG